MPENGKTGGKAEAPRKKKKVTPTLKQRIAFNILARIVGKAAGRKSITIGKVLEKAGYSKEIQDSPKKVTESDGWKALLEEKFPDGELTDRMDEQLNAHQIEHYIFSSKMSDEEIKEIVQDDFGFKVMRIKKQLNWKRAYFSIPDHLSRDKVIEKILKLKNKYPAEKHEHLVATVEIVEYR